MSKAAQSWNMTLAEVLDIDEECIKAKQRLDEAYNALAKERAGGLGGSPGGSRELISTGRIMRSGSGRRPWNRRERIIRKPWTKLQRPVCSGGASAATRCSWPGMRR